MKMSLAPCFGAPGSIIFVVGAQLLKKVTCTSQNSAGRNPKKVYEKKVYEKKV
jgi:hypothetical protein